MACSSGCVQGQVSGVCVYVVRMWYVGADREALSNHVKRLERGMFTDGQSDCLLRNPALVLSSGWSAKCNAVGREYVPVLLLYLHTYVRAYIVCSGECLNYYAPILAACFKCNPCEDP